MERRENKEQRKIYSYVVCFLLNNLGYNDDIRKIRELVYEKAMNKISDICSNTIGYGICLINTGSKIEGASLPLQGDLDVMCVPDDGLCTEESSKIQMFNTLKPVYSENVPPGYVRIAAVHLDNTSVLGNLCIKSYSNMTQDKMPYISSKAFLNHVNQKFESFPLSASFPGVHNDRFTSSGPAYSKAAGLQWGVILSFDLVPAIYFYSPIFMPRWAARPKNHSWPSSDVIKDVSTMEGYIVPVGSIDGETPDLEWRISYVTAENKLISNLNTTQFKLYIIMKMIAKELIYPDFPAISSYVVKNVVLWVCELNSQSLFIADLLFDQIMKCLSFLRHCLRNNHLPNYFIPERNLITLRVNVQSKRQLILRINNLLDDWQFIFSRLGIFKKHSPLGLILAPSSVYFFGKRRDQAEKHLMDTALLLLKLINITPDDTRRPTFLAYTLSIVSNNARFRSRFIEALSIIIPELNRLFMTSHNEQSVSFNELLSSGQFNELAASRLKLYLS